MSNKKNEIQFSYNSNRIPININDNDWNNGKKILEFIISDDRKIIIKKINDQYVRYEKIFLYERYTESTLDEIKLMDEYIIRNGMQ